jgi:hypothetical protein
MYAVVGDAVHERPDPGEHEQCVSASATNVFSRLTKQTIEAG